jgi:L-iditol 2-dehydrogenase
MKTLRLYDIHDMRLTDDPLPQVGPGESLVRVTAVGICGSDTHWYSEGGIGGTFLTEPLVLGHESSGLVENGELRGMRVAIDPAMPCNKCARCLEGNPNLCPRIRFAGTHGVDGTLRQYIAWPSENLFPLPEAISDAEGTVLEPLGVAMHAADLGPISPGQSVGVYGCGPVGLLIIQLVRLSGASRIFATDKKPDRLQAALGMGATDAFLADGTEAAKIWAASGNEGVDVAYEAAGDNAAVETSVATARFGGRVVIVGITADDRTIFTASTARRKGLTIMISRRSKFTYPRAIRLVMEGKINVKSLITHCFPLSEYDRAFKEAEARTGLKMVITL